MPRRWHEGAVTWILIGGRGKSETVVFYDPMHTRVRTNVARMTSREIVARILGDEVALDAVRIAFSGRHPCIPAYSWSSLVELKGEAILIAGSIYEQGRQIGRFSRRLMYARGYRQAIHEIMEIERLHRDNDIAKHHYARILAFYESVGIRYVRLDAEVEGTVVWPTFGFDFSRKTHREMLMKVLRDWEVSPLPSSSSLLAPRVVDINTEEYPELGLEAIYELSKRAGEPLPMVLDLQDPTQRAYLRNRGILT